MPRLKRLGARSSLYAIVTFFAVFAASPFFWMLITMFKQDADIYQPANNPFLFNDPPTLRHLDVLFNDTLYLTFVRNTVVLGALVVGITLLVVIPAAYSLARLTGRWGERMGIGIFLIYLVPPTLLFIPLSRVVAQLGFQDSLWSMVLVYPTFTIPFCTWLLMGFFKSIPRDIEEQAMVDGYSRLGAFVKTALPLSLPGILTVVIFALGLTFHEFIYALAFVSVSAHKTISVGVPTELIRGDVFFWQALMASALLVAIPIALVYNLFLNRFVAGFTSGAVKG
jgi:multiple sugar transport system permease protein